MVDEPKFESENDIVLGGNALSHVLAGLGVIDSSLDISAANEVIIDIETLKELPAYAIELLNIEQIANISPEDRGQLDFDQAQAVMDVMHSAWIEKLDNGYQPGTGLNIDENAPKFGDDDALNYNPGLGENIGGGSHLFKIDEHGEFIGDPEAIADFKENVDPTVLDNIIASARENGGLSVDRPNSGQTWHNRNDLINGALVTVENEYSEHDGSALTADGKVWQPPPPGLRNNEIISSEGVGTATSDSWNQEQIAVYYDEGTLTDLKESNFLGDSFVSAATNALASKLDNDMSFDQSVQAMDDEFDNTLKQMDAEFDAFKP